MRFKTGFFLGCAAGAWVASKASQLTRGDKAQSEWPRAVSPRAGHENAEVNAERGRALGDLARERLNGFLASPLGEMARDRLTGLVGSSSGRGNGGHPSGQHRRPV